MRLRRSKKVIIHVLRSSLIAVLTFGSVFFSTVISIIWFVTVSGDSRFAPAVQTLVLLGGAFGVLAERRAIARERRHILLLTLMDELRNDMQILNGPKFVPSKESPRPRVYPRLPVSATDAVLISGALAQWSDSELHRRLHNWRDEVNGFNRRLELTELRIFVLGTTEEILTFEDALYCQGGYIDQIRDQVRGLQNYLAGYR